MNLMGGLVDIRFGRPTLAGIGAALSLLASAGVFAQAVPTPGSVGDTVRRPAEPAPVPQAPAVDAPVPATSAPPADGPMLQVDRFEISGNSALSTETLLAAVASSTGRRLSLAEIYAVADQLTGLYRDRGYKLATVIVPAQRVSGGVVRLEVLEGRVGKLDFDGNRRYRSDFLRERIHGVDPGTILSTETLKEQLLHLNELPGLSTRATITPGASAGTSDILVHASERPWEAQLRIDNFGRVTIGEWRAQAVGVLNNPIGFGDRLRLDIVHAESGLLDYGRFDYELPVGPWGTRANVYFSHYDYDVLTKRLGPAFLGTQIGGSGENFGVAFVQPVLRGASDRLVVSAAFDRTVTHQDGLLSDSRNLSLFRLGAAYSHAWKNRAVSSLVGEVSTNFDNLDDDIAGFENNAQTFKLRVDAAHLMPLPASWSMLVRMSGVLSMDPLMDVERFRIGGPGSVRAFSAAEFAGDQGIDATIELSRPLRIVPALPSTVRVFYDAGVVYRRKPGAGENKTDGLTGVGVGLSTRVMDRLEIDFQVVTPTTAYRAGDGRDTRLWLSLQAEF